MFTVKVNSFAKQFSIVDAAIAALHADMAGDKKYKHPKYPDCDTIFVICALPSFAGTTGDPWSKQFPTVGQVLNKLEEQGIKIQFVE